MPRDQETTSEPVPVGTRTGAWPADTTATGPDGTTATNGGAFADRDVTSADQGVTSPADPAADIDPTRATVPDLGDPDLDAVPDAARRQPAGADAPFAAAGAAFVTDADGYRASWGRIQSGFVDDPRGSVTEAAELITQITSTLLSAVQERERTLRGTWDGGGDADTENLRNALRDYRSFFERLIGV